MSAVFFPPEGVTAENLKKILKEILELIPQKESLPEESILKTVSLEEKMDELKERIEKFMEFSFSALGACSGQASGVDGEKDKLEVIVSFLAMLELIKQGFMIFEQKHLFGNIQLKRHE